MDDDITCGMQTTILNNQSSSFWSHQQGLLSSAINVV